MHQHSTDTGYAHVNENINFNTVYTEVNLASLNVLNLCVVSNTEVTTSAISVISCIEITLGTREEQRHNVYRKESIGLNWTKKKTCQ